MKLIKWFASKIWSIKTYLLFILMTLTLVKMFTANYEFQSPVISKRAETYTQVYNERAICLTDLDLTQKEKMAAVLEANPDLK